MTVVSTRKNRFATYSRAFDAEGVGSFLEDVLAAKQRTRMIQEIPKLVPGGEEPEPEMEEMVEEEFDLSDILGEEVEGEAAMSKEQLAAKIERELEEEAAAAAAKAAEEGAAKAADTPQEEEEKKKRRERRPRSPNCERGEGFEREEAKVVSAAPWGLRSSFGRRESR